MRLNSISHCVYIDKLYYIKKAKNDLIRFNAISRYCYNKIHKILRNHFEHRKTTSYRVGVFWEIWEQETYLKSFGDGRLEKFLSFFGVGEVEFSHFTKEFHAAVF